MKRSVFRQVWWFRFPPDSSLRLAPIFSIPRPFLRFSVCGISMSDSIAFVALAPRVYTCTCSTGFYISRIIFKRRTERERGGRQPNTPERTREIRGDQSSRTGKSVSDERVINCAKGNVYAIKINRKVEKQNVTRCYTYRVR